MLKKFSKLQAEHQLIFAMVIAFAVISFWRGVWGLMDIFLYPGNPAASYQVSMGLGLVILVITGYATKNWR